MMISALNEGLPGAASACMMCRSTCVGGKNGCSCDSRESGCERSITRRGTSRLLSGQLLADLDDAGDQDREHLLARLGARLRRVADHSGGRDVAQHVHRHDHAGPAGAHLVAPERRPRQPRVPDGGAAVVRVARRAVFVDRLPERHRERGLRLLGVDHRPLDVREHVRGQVPPLDEEHAAVGRLEVVVDRDRERRDVAAVPVDREEVLEAVVGERVADLAEDLQEGRRREAHRAGKLHVVPGERHVERRRDEDAEALVGRQVGGAHRQRAGDEAVGVEGHVRPVLLGRADRDQDRVDPVVEPVGDLRPGHPLDAIFGHDCDLHRMSDIVQYSPGVETEVNGVRLWYEASGDGEPVIQIHGAGFGHFNFAPATPELSKRFRVIDYDMRGYGQSERPVQHYDMEVWADDVAGLLDALDIEAAHVHGTSMGGMIAIVFAGKYPQRTTSVVINCAAAKLGQAGRLVFKNWIDIARIDPDGPGSRILAELIAWQALSKAFLETPEGVAAIDTIQQILRDSNSIEPFTAACQAMCDMDIREWLPKITSPALVLGGDEDLMTPWDRGPEGAGGEAIWGATGGAEKHVPRGSTPPTFFNNPADHTRVVIVFFNRHSS